ncbi:serine O-acetyltransferase EpsC [Polycyclovorans algicola]|uniref:serine O-acetyltransferase EpsC n=1 Tax=Polycyclovorans algicola TaxID=616992 RepID=UPI0004A6F589|nr:serine O-acetyltransferase EpsC [Polycyclovorans algicola]
MKLPPEAPMGWDLGEIVSGLRGAREQWRLRQQREQGRKDREFPSVDRIACAIKLLRGALFPLRLGPVELKREGEDFYVGHALDQALNALVEEVRLELSSRGNVNGGGDAAAEARRRVAAFAAQLPAIRTLLDGDVEAAYEGDPAARNVDEVLLCYPGILALIHHRLAHALYKLELPLLARIVAEIAHSATGIDIHPGATIGEHFFIDHGTGVVIGETAIIGQRVRLYQAVTLGAKRFEVGEDGQLTKGNARHPIVEDDVVIYAGATILGRITIGKGSSIGGNVWLTHSVPPGSQISQARMEEGAPVVK